MKNLGMKTTVIVAAVAVVLIGLVAYGVSNKNEVTTCELKDDLTTIKYEYEHEKDSDELIKVTSISKTKYKELNWTKEDALDQLEVYSKSIEGEGVEYTYEIDGDVMIETLEVDLEKADPVYLSELNYISRPAEDSRVVSLEETIKNAESLNAKCDDKE